MIIDIENVTEKFKLYSGEELDGTEPGRDGLCREICRECAAEVTGRVRPEVMQRNDPDDIGALESLAAAEAFYQLADLDQRTAPLADLDQRTAPLAVSSREMKIELGDRLGAAGRLRDGKRLACVRLLVEYEFYFRAI